MADDGERMPDKIEMSSYSLPANAKIRMLGTDTYLKRVKRDNGFTIIIPDKIRKTPPAKYVWVLKATY